MKPKLIEICKKYKADSNIAVIPEPYIPYIPENWNRILILAESQNLSKNNQGYVDWLNSILPIDRILRLNKNKDYVGVYPWDDGSLKLAIEASLNVKACETAVSNAVLWSQRSNTGANKNPSGIINELSIKIWSEFLNILSPKTIIVAGKIAKNIIYNTKWKGMIIPLRLPSKRAMSLISGMFEQNDLLKRFPEVNKIINIKPHYVDKYKQNKIFYACHAVSIVSKYKK